MTDTMASLSSEPTEPKEVRKYLQQSHDRIFENNRKWAAEQKVKNPEFFEKLTAGQAPDYLWIGESSRFLQILPFHLHPAYHSASYSYLMGT